ncbi:MAG: MFS transporter [Rhodobacteraceae bacterium]|nr:MFS transporter [Paracoccaceae bacterium]
MSPDPREPSQAPLPGRRAAMAVLLLANFMNLIDVTIVNVAVPSLQADLGASDSGIAWIIAAYIFTFALWLVPAGRMGDLYGRRRMFLIGVAIFTVASALCGLATSTEGLIAARVAQGLGGALMTPQTLALVPALFPPQERGAVFALFGVTAGLAAVAGPILGGVLIGADILGLGWRPIFLVNLPLGALAIWGALRLVPAVPGRPTLGVDFVGMALAGLAVLLALFPLIEGRNLGWPLWCLVLLAMAVPVAGLFALWQRRQAARGAPQLIPASLLRARSFLLGGGAAALFFSGVPGFFLVLALYLQVGHGLTPLQSGLTTTPFSVGPFSVGIFAASVLSSRLGARWPRRRIAAGAVLVAAAMLGLRELVLYGDAAITWWRYAVPLSVAGIGLGTAVSPLFQTALADVPPDAAGVASGAVQALQQVGSAFGVAIMGEIFFARLARSAGGAGAPLHADYAAALTQAMVYATVAFAAVAVLSAALPRLAANDPRLAARDPRLAAPGP